VTPALLGLVLAIAAPLPKESPRPAPADNPLMGEWVVESHIASGKPIPIRDKPERVMITKDLWKVGKELKTESNLWLDPTKDPPQIDVWVPTQGEEARVRGIYKLDGDILTVCYTLGADRPTKFDSPVKSGIWLMTLKKSRPAK
jgi:uncharacterized protein (TIGR03067 family)